MESVRVVGKQCPAVLRGKLTTRWFRFRGIEPLGLLGSMVGTGSISRRYHCSGADVSRYAIANDPVECEISGSAPVRSNGMSTDLSSTVSGRAWDQWVVMYGDDDLVVVTEEDNAHDGYLD